MYLSSVFSVLAVAVSFASAVQAKAVFAHYMVGTIYENNAHTDIDNALAMGLDGFALNIGDPTQTFVRNTLNYMFDYAYSKNFKLFVSMDLSAAAASGKGVNDYYPILRDFKGHPAYYTGPNGYSFISTYGDGGLTNTQWNSWKSTWANVLYFVPDFDATQGYYTADPGWWSYWGNVIDGVFSWESAWPQVGATNAGSVDLDKVVLGGTSQHGKSYMMPLSTLQYKDAYNTNLYRQGELNLPARMQNILAMSPAPSYIEIITWNDGPESHYIGNLWPESSTAPDANVYANQASWPHNAWQSVITSFINAYKAGLPASSMTPPPGGAVAVGSMWYKTILQSSVCTPADNSYHYQKPAGFSTGRDNLNWAIVLASSAAGAGMQIRAVTNGAVLTTVPATAGLNYGAAGPVQPGPQRVELVDRNGNVILAARSVRNVDGGCPDGIYNFNYQVAGLA